MAIGRITGSVLKSNLTRNGTDLAFETNLLYLDVTNSRVGIGTSEPSTTLQVNGTVTATTVAGATDLNLSAAANGDINIPANIGLTFGNDGEKIEGDGTNLTINSSGDVNLDAAGDIILDAGGGDLIWRDDGVELLKIYNNSSNVNIKAQTQDKDLSFQGNDGGSGITALTLDMSEAGAATFNSTIAATGLTINSAYTLPTADGSSGQFLTTDGSGTLSFATVSTNSISQANSNVTVTDSGTGAVTVAADGNTIITMNASITLDASAATNSIRLPVGTTAQRPSGSTGEIRYNSSTDAIEGYTTAGGWAQLGATSSTAENTDDTATGNSTAISTTEKIVNQFTTSSFDSAWYLAVTRDEINDQVSTAKYSMAHNNSAAVVSTSHITRSDATNSFVSVDADVTGGNARLKATGASVVNSVSFYRIALGDNTTAGTTGSVTTVINTDVDSASESIDSWAKASYRAAKYYISVNNASKTEVTNIEALVVHDGTTAFITAYGVTNTGSNDLASLTAAVDGDNVVVSAQGNEPNLRVTTYRILLADDESGSTGDNVNVIAATTVSSTATTVDSFANSAYTGAFYVFTGYNSTEGAASATEVMVISNDDAYISTGPTISSKGTDQLEFSATQSGSTVTVKAASTSGSSTTVNGYRVHMLRGSAGASTADTVLVSTEQTISGAKTFSNSVVMMTNLPTSDPNNAGQLWNSSGTLKISAG